jgi:hypothetical protein
MRASLNGLKTLGLVIRLRVAMFSKIGFDEEESEGPPCSRRDSSLSIPLLSSNTMAHGSDALDRELASLKETIGLTNPVTYGVKGDWCV